MQFNITFFYDNRQQACIDSLKAVYNQYRHPIKSYLKFNAVIEKGIAGDNPAFGQQTTY